MKIIQTSNRHLATVLLYRNYKTSLFPLYLTKTTPNHTITAFRLQLLICLTSKPTPQLKIQYKLNVSLTELSVATLRTWCRSRGVSPDGKKKAELVALLLSAETGLSTQSQRGEDNDMPAAIQVQPSQASTVEEIYQRRLNLLGEGLTASERWELLRSIQEEVRESHQNNGPPTGSSATSEIMDRQAMLKLSAAFPPFTEDKESIDAYLETFEILCRTHRIPEEEWTCILAGRLTGRASATYRALLDDQRADYEEVKQALLARYAITPETYRQQFRTITKGTGDTYVEYSNKLAHALNHWMRGCGVETLEDCRQLCLKEQFLECCSLEVREWVMDRDPQTLEEAAQLADKFVETRAQTRKRTTQRPIERVAQPLDQQGLNSRLTRQAPLLSKGPKSCFKCGSTNHLQATCPKTGSQALSVVPVVGEDLPLSPMRPPFKKDPTTGEDFVVMASHWENSARQKNRTVALTVDGRPVEGVIDSGAFMTLVEPHVVTADKLVPGKTAGVILLGGERQQVPMAQVTLDWGKGPITHTVGIMDQLPAEVLLGNDVGEICCTIMRAQRTKGQCRRYGPPTRRSAHRVVVSGPPTRRSAHRVVVSGLPPSGSWQDLKDHMREAGHVCYTDVYRNGIGVVEFVRKEHVTCAVQRLDNTKFRSHKGDMANIRVHIA